MSGPTRKAGAVSAESTPASKPSPADARSVDLDHSPALDRAIQSQIGDRLRSLYGELSSQPVPDKLVAILDRLGKS